jgi:hypothetical protein
MRDYPFLLAGRPSQSHTPVDVVSPYDGTSVGRTWLAGPPEFEEAARAAVAAEEP